MSKVRKILKNHFFAVPDTLQKLQLDALVGRNIGIRLLHWSREKKTHRIFRGGKRKHPTGTYWCSQFKNSTVSYVTNFEKSRLMIICIEADLQVFCVNFTLVRGKLNETNCIKTSLSLAFVCSQDRTSLSEEMVKIIFVMCDLFRHQQNKYANLRSIKTYWYHLTSFQVSKPAR